jgi:hypothetical protein
MAQKRSGISIEAVQLKDVPKLSIITTKIL